MSDAADKRIAELEQEVRAAQELLFLVLHANGEPVVLDIEASRELMAKGDKRIDLDLDQDETTWTLSVVDI